MQPATVFSIISLGVGQCWSIEGCTNLYRIAYRTLTTIRYWDEILRPIVRHLTGAVGPGSSWYTIIPSLMWQEYARFSCQNLYNWPSCSYDLNIIEHFWGIMVPSIWCRQVAPQTVQKLSDVMVRIWEEIPKDTISLCIRSMLDVVRHAYKHMGPSKLLSCCKDISANMSSEKILSAWKGSNHWHKLNEENI